MEKPPTLINLLIHPLPPTLGGFCPAFSSDQNCLVQDESNSSDTITVIAYLNR